MLRVLNKRSKFIELFTNRLGRIDDLISGRLTTTRPHEVVAVRKFQRKRMVVSQSTCFYEHDVSFIC